MRRGSYTVVKLESCPENSAHNGAPADPAAMSVPSVSSLERLATPPRIEANAGWRYASECEEGRSPTAVRATSDEQRWRPPSSTRLQKVPAEDEAKRQAPSNQEALSAEFLEQTSTMHRRALIELQSTLSQKASASYFDDNYSAAAACFLQALHVADKCNAPADARAVLRFNYGACQHGRNRFDDAVEAYESSLALFHACRPSNAFSRWWVGELLQTRIAHIERMQALARRGEMPRRGEFLDCAGELRHDGRKHCQ